MARPVRLAGFEYRGLYRYFVTICTLDRVVRFRDAPLVEEILSLFLEQADAHGFAVIAYCFMPDHAHLLVEGRRGDADLHRFMHAAKQHTGFEFGRRCPGQTLWQKGYYERILRDDDATGDVTRYILANPVRAELVQEPHDYPFSGSLEFTRDQLDDLWTGREWHP